MYVDETIPIISDRYRVYHFDGKEFVEKGASAHKGLHKSLANYYRLASYFRTKAHLVRVDWLDYKGALRYASWNSPMDISRQPNLVIQGGAYDEEKNTYTFADDGYEYVVGYSKTSLFRKECMNTMSSCWSKRTVKSFSKKKEKVLMKNRF